MALRYFIPSFAWGLLIFIAISLPPGNIPKKGLFSIPHFDKVVHFLLFSVFGLLLAAAFYLQKRKGLLRKYFVWFTLSTGLLYGILTEALQHFYFAGRNGSIIDVAADLFGTVFGVLLFSLLLKIRPEFSK